MRPWKWLMLALLVLTMARPAWAGDDVDRVRQVLREHPEILVEALQKQGRAVLEILENAARERQREMERLRFAQALDKPLVPDMKTARASRGPVDAPVTIVEYSDFLCHFCKQAAGMVNELLKQHPKDVRLVFKHYATGKNDVRAAIFFEAINLQDPAKAWAFMDEVFANQQAVQDKGDEALKGLAKKTGADMKRLAEDVKRQDLADRVKADVKEARDFGFEGTPVFLVNGAPVRGAVPLPAMDGFVKLAAEKAKNVPAKGEAKP